MLKFIDQISVDGLLALGPDLVKVFVFSEMLNSGILNFIKLKNRESLGYLAGSGRRVSDF